MGAPRAPMRYPATSKVSRLAWWRPRRWQYQAFDGVVSRWGRVWTRRGAVRAIEQFFAERDALTGRLVKPGNEGSAP